jgi:hypothetical protein
VIITGRTPTPSCPPTRHGSSIRACTMIYVRNFVGVLKLSSRHYSNSDFRFAPLRFKIFPNKRYMPSPKRGLRVSKQYPILATYTYSLDAFACFCDAAFLTVCLCNSAAQSLINSGFSVSSRNTVSPALSTMSGSSDASRIAWKLSSSGPRLRDVGQRIDMSSTEQVFVCACL